MLLQKKIKELDVDGNTKASYLAKLLILQMMLNAIIKAGYDIQINVDVDNVYLGKDYMNPDLVESLQLSEACLQTDVFKAYEYIIMHEVGKRVLLILEQGRGREVCRGALESFKNLVNLNILRTYQSTDGYGELISMLLEDSVALLIMRGIYHDDKNGWATCAESYITGMVEVEKENETNDLFFERKRILLNMAKSLNKTENEMEG